MNGANPEARTVRARIALAALGAVIAVAVASGCAGDGGEPPVVDYGTVLLRVAWPLNPTGPATVAVVPADTKVLRVFINASDMEPINLAITQNDVIAGVIARSIPVPVGAGRSMIVQALDAQNRVLAAGKAVFDVVQGETVRIRIVLVPMNSGDPTDPPEVVSRTFILTEWSGNFAPLTLAAQQADALLEPVAEDAVSLRRSLPYDALSGSLTLDIFEALPSGDRPIVGTLIIHNNAELWMVRGYYEGPLDGDIVLDPTITNPYISGPGGWTTRFTGSVLDEDLVVTQILDGLSAPSTLQFQFQGGDPLTDGGVDAEVKVLTPLGRTLIGDMSGQLVF